MRSISTRFDKGDKASFAAENMPMIKKGYASGFGGKVSINTEALLFNEKRNEIVEEDPLGTPSMSNRGNLNAAKTKKVVIPANNKEHRKMIYEQIFKGDAPNDKTLFLNPSNRGYKILPYSKHTKMMINEIESKIRKFSPERKVTIDMGVEVPPSLDTILKEESKPQEEDGGGSPKRKTRKTVKVCPPTGYLDYTNNKNS